ncbi:MAG: hypothetical protein H6618_09960 [Deltaproteobacteria bacterium]|nr:hypothetical protein [Deltaproteobacteria bacterium]
MNPKHKVAIRRSCLMALFLSIPLLFILYHHQQNNQSGQPEVLNESDDFYFVTEDGNPFTKSSLRNMISLLAFVPKDCVRCQQERFRQVQSWAELHLKHRSQTHLSWQLLVFGSEQSTPGDGWLRLHSPPGIEASPEEEMLPITGSSTLDTDRISWIMINENGSVLGIFPDEESSWEALTRLWSKSLFNQYLSSYLSTRTFFGPRR